MVYIIILGVLVVALAPLWHFKPTKRQKHQAAMREAAALSGLFVEMRDLPLPAAQLERLAASERQVLYYGCRLTSSLHALDGKQSWWRRNADWESNPRRVEAPEILSRLPQSVLAIACSNDSCGFYWREEGSVEEVRELAGILFDWRDSFVR